MSESLASVVAAVEAKKVNTMREVALVGPRMVWRELEKSGATMDAIMELTIP